MSGDAWPGPGHVPVVHNRWKDMPPAADPPTVSVIVCHYEQHDDLDRLLAGIALQRGPIDLKEVIVVDDGSTEAPAPPSSAGTVPVTVLCQADHGVRPAAARNLGVRHSRGEVLVFLDADTTPGPETVARLAALPAVAPDAFTVGRRHHVDLEGWSPEATTNWLAGRGPAPSRLEDPAWLRAAYERTQDLVAVDDRCYQYVIGAVMATSRRFFDHLRGFDASITTYGGEDWELAYRAYAAGGVLAHCPDADAFHNGGDWGERNHHRGRKNDERLEVARTIPGATDGLIGPWATLLVTLRTQGWPLDTTVAVIAALLCDGGTEARISVIDPPAGLAGVVAADSRVLLAPHGPATVTRALRHLDMAQPLKVGEGSLAALAALVAPGAAGQVELVDRGEVVATVSSTRACARARRWTDRLGGYEQALDELFGRERQSLPPRVARLDAVPDLNDSFPR
ncbi:MAG: glycosyltransferase family 2 protein [Acidimicrobiales bacterium]